MDDINNNTPAPRSLPSATDSLANARQGRSGGPERGKTKGLIEQYRPFLPVSAKTPVISLLEGDTPLIPSRCLPERLGVDVAVYFKFEGLNPTGSFKDRGMTVAISLGVERGSKAMLCASTGNTSASAAAYAARAGVPCVVLLPHGAIALGKLAQALMHGARVIPIDGNFDDALKLVKEVSQVRPILVVNSINPDRLEGQKTAAFEIVDALGEAPDIQCIPVGNGGNITAYWKGYREYKDKGFCRKLPILWGFQAAGSAPLVKDCIVAKPETIATAIRIGNPALRSGAVEAKNQSQGFFDAVTDEEILAASQFLATREGLFCEPASAASVAGLIKSAGEGRLKAGQVIVCIITGHGLKDPDQVTRLHKIPATVKPELNAVLKAAGL